MIKTYIELIIATIMPAIFALILFYLNKKTRFGKLKPLIKQIIYGLVFGGLAIISTEFGPKIDDAMINCRDGAVMTAGLFFGWEAGIIAGLIGGIERWLCVYWGGGTFTRLACSISTILAGFFSAFIRKVMLKDKKPSWLVACVMTFVIETLHLLMVFITNFNEPTKAIAVVKSCSVLMLIINSIGALLSGIVLTLISKEKLFEKQKLPKISSLIQKDMFLSVAITLVLSLSFIYFFQNRLAKDQIRLQLTQVAEDVSEDLVDTSNDMIVTDLDGIESLLETKSAKTICLELGLCEVTLVEKEITLEKSTWTIKACSNEYLIGNDLRTDYKDFLKYTPLLRGEDDFDPNLTYLFLDYDPVDKVKYAAKRIGDGIIIIGYDKERFIKGFKEEIEYKFYNRRIGNTGLIMVLDIDCNVIESGKLLDDEYELIGTKINQSVLANLELARYDINGQPYYAYFDKVNEFYIVTLISEAEALETQNISVYVNTFLEIIIFALLFIQIYILIRKVITSKLEKVNNSLSLITKGNLNEIVDVKDSEEFKCLSDDINHTVDTIKKYIGEAEARIEKELELAKNIQHSALPTVTKQFSVRKDMDIFATMDAAKEVGGDFYDFYFTDDETLNILIADVSGKGIPAAMFMMKAKAILKGLTEKGLPVDEVFTQANEKLCESNDAGMFITAWQAQINLLTGEVTYVNAGHNPPLFKGNDGKYQYLVGKAGFVLAGFDGFIYKTQSFKMEAGNALFLYTDGVTESTNMEGQLYGESNLLSVLNEKDYNSPEEICNRVKKEALDFTGDAPQFDDITTLSFVYNGKPLIKELYIEDATISSIEEITDFVDENLESIDASTSDIIKINIAIDEIVSNIVNYGYKDNKGPIKVLIRQTTDLKAVTVRFIDKGIPYNPITAKDPDITLSAEQRQIGGLGIYMVKKSMDDIRYRYEEGQNILTIKKILFDSDDELKKIG